MKLFMIILFISFVPWIGQAGELTPLYKGYPEVFSLEGVIDDVSEKKIVINDTLYKITNQCIFYRPKGKTNTSTFKVGDKVGVILKKGGEWELLSVWLLSKGAKTNSPKSDNKSKSNSIYRKDGVWIN